MRLEIIGEEYHWLRKNRRRATVQRRLPLRKEIDIIRYGRKSLRPWVARLTGLDDRYGFKREFLTGMRDWSLANSTGSRGVYEYFALTPGIYEINECIKLGVSRRYFVRADETIYHEISRYEVCQCLTNAD